jgi:hypothetical protein
MSGKDTNSDGKARQSGEHILKRARKLERDMRNSKARLAQLERELWEAIAELEKVLRT